MVSLHDGFQYLQALVDLGIGSDADSQAVAPAGIVHVSDKDSPLFELLVEWLGWEARMDVPSEIGL
jgi:hypothetical protein